MYHLNPSCCLGFPFNSRGDLIRQAYWRNRGSLQLFEPSQQRRLGPLQQLTSLSQQEQSPRPCTSPAPCVSNAKQDTTPCIHFTRQVTVAQHRPYRSHKLSCGDGVVAMLELVGLTSKKMLVPATLMPWRHAGP
jgi:hypothetical protein